MSIVYVLVKKYGISADVVGASIVTDDGLRLSYGSSGNTNFSVDQTNFKTASSASNKGGAYIKDVKNGNKQYSPASFKSNGIKNSNNTIEENSSLNNLKLNSKITSKPGRLEYNLILSKSSNQDMPINLCYSMPIDAEGWSWYDDIYNSRKITGKEVYTKLVTAGSPENDAIAHFEYQNPLSRYPLGLIVSPDSSVGLSFAVPPDKPRAFYTQYDNASKKYSACFDFMLTESTVNFNNSVDVSFSLYKINNPESGFRSALEKYYSFYPEAFTKGGEAGSFYYSSITDSKYNLQDYNFKYDWAFGIDTKRLETAKASGAKSSIYSWLDGYFLGRNVSYYKSDEDCTVNENYSSFTDNFITKVLKNSITPKYFCSASPNFQTGEKFWSSQCQVNPEPSSIGCVAKKKVYFGKEVENNLLGLDPRVGTCNARSQASATIKKDGNTESYGAPCASAYCSSADSKSPLQAMNPSPSLPAPPVLIDDGGNNTCQGINNWGKENIKNSVQVASQYGYDGVSIDTYGIYGLADFNQKHFKNVTVPLTYDKATNRPIAYQPFSLYEYMKELRQELPKEKKINANGLGQASPGFLQSFIDVFMGERNGNLINVESSSSAFSVDPEFSRLRSLVYHKPYTVIINKYDNADAMNKINYLAFFGNFSYLAKNNEGKYFFSTATPTAAQLNEYKLTQQAVKTISDAGWEPVTYATSNLPDVKIERFGSKDKKKIYLSIRNFSDAAKQSKILLDPKLFLSVKEAGYANILGDPKVVKADDGFTVSVDGKRTYVVEITTKEPATILDPTPSAVLPGDVAGSLSVPKGFTAYGTTEKFPSTQITSLGLEVYKYSLTSKKWQIAPAEPFNIEPSVGYYIYNPSEAKKVSLPYKTSTINIHKVSKGWNLLWAHRDETKTTIRLELSGSTNTLQNWIASNKVKNSVFIVEAHSSPDSCQYSKLSYSIGVPLDCPANTQALSTLTKIPSSNAFWIYVQ